jgi:hypothetical protein
VIAVRRVPRAEWQAELKHYGCYPATGLTSLNTAAEWWRYPWGGYPFTVPVDDEGWLLQHDLDYLILDIIQLADERGWEFPDRD